MGGEEDLTSDHIINAPNILFVLLTLPFTSMLVYGFSLDAMLVGTLVSIPKDNRQLVCIPNSFTPVALSSIVSELFDAVILSKELCMCVYIIAFAILS